jgi:V-type H+-transporting ATPase subunit a
MAEDDLTGQMFRSQPMEFHKILIPGAKDLNVAHDMMERLLDTKSVMIIDMNESVLDNNRRYKAQEQLALDCKKRLSFLVNKTNDYLDGDDENGSRSLQVFSSQNLDSDVDMDINAIDDKLREIQSNIMVHDKTVADLTRQMNSKKEHHFVIDLCTKVLAAASDTGYAGSYDPYVGALGDAEAGSAIALQEGANMAPGAVSHICGVINADRQERFRATLFRVMRSNVVTTIMPIPEPLPDPKTGEQVSKSVFITFLTSQSMMEKARKICDAFQCNLYDCPRMTTAQQQALIAQEGLKETDIDRLKHVIEQTQEENVQYFWQVAKNLDAWGSVIMREWKIFNTLNKFKIDDDAGITSEYLYAKCWIPAKKRDLIRGALTISSMTGYSSQGEQGFLSPPSGIPEWPADPSADLAQQLEAAVVGGVRIPTYFATNKYTGAFQGIVDAYGVARYQEANPTLFAFSIFPFLFGVMFGDILHGSFLLIFALLCIRYEKSLANVTNEMFTIPFGGRYLLVIMSVSAIYMGFIYNEVASVPLDLFGSAYDVHEHGEKVLEGAEHFGMPYLLGVDPKWRWSNNNVGFTNSMKMKMAIILGVIHMTLGVVIKAMNCIHFGDKLSLMCESGPEIVLFMSIFGYLLMLIFIKWSTNWNIGPDCTAVAGTMDIESEAFRLCALSTTRIQYPRGPPALITALIGLAFGGSVTNKDVLVFVDGCDKQPPKLGEDGPEMYGPDGFCPGQTYLQFFLLFLAFVSVPIMLIVKPFVLKAQAAQAAEAEGYAHLGDGTPRQLQDEDEERALVSGGGGGGGHGGHDDEEGFNFGEVFIHQIIHTIEYALGTVSNTASYLRLWALSLAHSQLSEVFWDMIFLGDKFSVGLCSGSTFMIVCCFFIWFASTMAVLMVMESLSAFLHALRLQWVEFQNKFYASDGFLFEPDTFDIVESDN